MATHTRTTKTTGGTNWVDGSVVTAAEFNAEWDGLVTDYNGNINDDNIALTAGKLIDSDKINDHAASDAAFTGSGSSPGDLFTPTKPTDLRGELEALRYRIKQNVGGDNFNAMSAASAVTPPRPIISRNVAQA